MNVEQPALCNEMLLKQGGEGHACSTTRRSLSCCFFRDRSHCAVSVRRCGDHFSICPSAVPSTPRPFYCQHHTTKMSDKLRYRTFKPSSGSNLLNVTPGWLSTRSVQPHLTASAHENYKQTHNTRMGMLLAWTRSSCFA